MASIIYRYTLVYLDTMAITTIKLNVKTKERIDKLRVYKRETYDEIVQTMLNILNTCRANPESARIKLLSIDRTRKKQRLSPISDLLSEPAQDLEHNRQSS